MPRNLLQIDGVPPETRKALQEAAREKYGQANASMLVRLLIASHLSKDRAAAARPLSEAEAGDMVRVELRLPRVVVEKINGLAENRLSARNYYLSSIILAHIGQPQLQGDEIETLRRSNYVLSKVGTNLNQIAKAFNILVNGGKGKMPEIGKKMAALRREISEHVGRVLRVLDSGTSIFEVRQGRGQKPRQGKH
jgi:hypothetical protein